ncbi:hypothetical protein F2Q69_00025975 [Brassica cretica]|uniref:Uncharacterized protein n=1 Tax=Brassica cretica TaxID=69181 RepID=A0A8S9S431_BRACR|nr:hypothetical protein F2Q69_00025975 [Brassica cretica]
MRKESLQGRLAAINTLLSCLRWRGRRSLIINTSETIEEEHDAGKDRELERITAEERRNEPRPDTERDCHDEDVDRDDG